MKSVNIKKIKQRHKYEVEKDGEYEYIKSYFTGDILPNGKVIVKGQYVQVKHKYCNNTYVVTANNFINKKQRCNKCCGSYENSFAHHIIEELGESLEKYWDFEKNTVNPYHISKCSDNQSVGKVWIKCQEKNYHGSYETRCGNFASGKRCSYCGNLKVHPLDSFGQWLKDNNLLHLWSNKNTVNPFGVSKFSTKEIWMLCSKEDIHNVNNGYKTRCSHFTRGERCPNCNNSKGEDRIDKWLVENRIYYKIQKPFDGLLGVNNGNLRYDFYLPKHNLLIEYQGEQHERYIKGFHKSYGDFEKQLEHDKRKRQYAIDNNINLLEIWYCDFDNIENILKTIVNYKHVVE